MAAANQIKVPMGKVLSLRLEKDQIDKAHKDKNSWLGSKRFPENFSVTLILMKEEDQIETLNPPAFLMQPLSN